jgi:membrane protein DedA with SNARE-associated domain
MVSAVYAVATIPLTPALIDSHPVLLELLTGGTSSIVAAGAFSDVDSKLQLTLVVAAALPGMMRFDWAYWWAGKLWGHRIIEKLGHHSSRTARLALMAETRGRRWAGPLVALAAFVPSGASTAVYAAAGWTGLPLIAFILWDTLGSAAWISLLAWFGYQLGTDGVHLAALVSRYALVTIGVLVITMIAPQAWHTWRERRARNARASSTLASNALAGSGLAGPAVPAIAGSPGSAGPAGSVGSAAEGPPSAAAAVPESAAGRARSVWRWLAGR